MTNNPRWMGLLVFIQTPVILAVVAIVAGEPVFLFTLLGLMVGGASFLVGLWVAARHRQMKGREVVKSRITWSLLGSKIRLSFLVVTPDHCFIWRSEHKHFGCDRVGRTYHL